MIASFVMRWGAMLLAFVVALGAGEAHAQSRGGRMGGSGFGGGSSSGSSSGSSGSSSGSSGSNWGSGSSGSGSTSPVAAPAPPAPRPTAASVTPPPAETPRPAAFGQQHPPQSELEARQDPAAFNSFSGAACCAACFGFPALLLLAWFFGYDKRSRDNRRAETKARNAAMAMQGQDEVRRISIGFDWSVRRELQQTLDRMAETLSFDSGTDRRQAASLLADSLGQALGGARYFSYQSMRTEGSETEATFLRMKGDLAARFKHDRGHDAADLRAHKNEGEGLVVVSVVLATDSGMPALPEANDVGAVAAAVAGLKTIRAPTVLALEIVWSPAEEMDRMSSLELEANYPELQRLDDARAIGRIGCGYCRAPFPAELGRCPACGAPAAQPSPQA